MLNACLNMLDVKLGLLSAKIITDGWIVAIQTAKMLICESSLVGSYSRHCETMQRFGDSSTGQPPYINY